MKLRLLLAAAAAMVTLQATAQVESREGIALENEILELRQQVQQTQQQLAGLQQLQSQTGAAPVAAPVPQGDGQVPAAGAPNDLVAQLVVRVSSLEEQMRTLQGRVEEIANAQQRDHDDLVKQIGDLAFKVNGGSAPGAPAPDPAQGGTAAPDAAVPDLTPTPKPPPPAAPPRRTAEQSLKLGNAALARRDYEAASAAAQEVLASGRGPRTPDAQFLLARAEAGKHDYKAAAASYYAVYKAAPRTPRAAESLIGVANAFAGMGDKAHACQALVKLGAEFPHPEANLHAAATAARKRAGC